MNIGRTVRVFRAEPVMSPLPVDPAREHPGPDVQAERTVVEAVPAPEPVRAGG